jgi:enamine deaminase RidA (YjgF/YER057c/UK114 family)
VTLPRGPGAQIAAPSGGATNIVKTTKGNPFGTSYGGRLDKKLVNPWTWQDNFGFSQAIEISGHTRVLRCAGQTSVNENGEPQHEGDMTAQIGLALDNLETVLKAAGMTLSNVVRLNIYTTDIDAFIANWLASAERLAKADCQPASTLLGVARLAGPQLLVEIEATAVA